MGEVGAAALVPQVRAALESGDFAACRDLLDPHVTWGPPGVERPPCRTREQVLRWYERGRAQGRRARLLDVTAHGDRILVTMAVSSAANPAETLRWQVLTVADGRIVDIRGYDEDAEARAAAGIRR